jgi:hypothetical protein
MYFFFNFLLKLNILYIIIMVNLSFDNLWQSIIQNKNNEFSVNVPANIKTKIIENIKCKENDDKKFADYIVLCNNQFLNYLKRFFYYIFNYFYTKYKNKDFQFFCIFFFIIFLLYSYYKNNHINSDINNLVF